MIYLLLLVCPTPFLVEGSQLFQDYNLKYSEFTVKVYQELRKLNSGSFLVSPLSANVILALVTSGANGKTAKELSSALGVPNNSEKIKEMFNEVTSKLNNCYKYNLSIANKVYIQHSYSLSAAFRDTAVKAFDAEIESIDFGNAATAVAKINKWVEDQTRNKIKDLIDPSSMETNTRCILVSAMYFQGYWANQFSQPKKAEFFIKPKVKVEVDMMETIIRSNFYQSSELNAKFLELPYVGDGVSMIVVLPNKVDGLPELESKLSNVLSNPHFESKLLVHVRLPKFKLDTDIDFEHILKKLGVKDAFTLMANFSGMLSNNRSLPITKVQQKTFIEVDQEGTTAAAATYVIFYERSNPERKLGGRFYANHPFLFYLYLKKLDIKFCIGRYVGPVS